MNTEIRGAWTLVESLVVTAIVALLIAIAIPSLRQARLYADSASDLADLRTHTEVLIMYTSDSGGAFPNFIDPKFGIGPVPGSSMTSVPYFAQCQFWAIPLLDGYYERAGVLGDVFYLRSAERDLEGGTLGHNPSYVYGATFLAFPAFWNPETRMAPPAQLGTVRIDQVRYSSRKALVDVIASNGGMNQSDGGKGTRVLAAFVDGSAASFPLNETEPGYFDGTGNWEPWGTGRYPGTRLAYTIDGVHGFDMKSR